MSIQDYINSMLELGGSITLWLNVLALYRAKQVRGVHLSGAAFFTCWGVWNLYYYPSLGQWASFFGGLSVAGANATWLALAVYYGRRK